MASLSAPNITSNKKEKKINLHTARHERGMEIGGNGEIGDGGSGWLRSWPHSSRIIRVSRASGGKDRHSKVWTTKGARDRRIRLSVATAIQFYDLQDRLGVDQPSKAVEWLINAAADSISELPSLNPAFPETPRQVSDEKKPGFGLDSPISQQMISRSRSDACSSGSETSKLSGGVSIWRNGIRVRAGERTAKEKETETESTPSSFTQLLTAGIGNLGSNSGMDCFNGTGSRAGRFSGMAMTPYYSVGVEHQHIPFLPDQDQYNLNFTTSPSNLSGFNRGTLQSNSSQSLLSQQQQQFQRCSVSPMDGATMTSVPFFLGAPLETQQLYYGDNGGRQSDHKGKG